MGNNSLPCVGCCSDSGVGSSGVSVTAFVISVCSLGLLPIILFLRGMHKYRSLKKDHKNFVEQQLDGALDTTLKMKFPLVLMSAQQFSELGKLTAHEELRDRGMLQYYDTHEQIMRAPNPIIFFSHQVCART